MFHEERGGNSAAQPPSPEPDRWRLSHLPEQVRGCAAYPVQLTDAGRPGGRFPRAMAGIEVHHSPLAPITGTVDSSNCEGSWEM